MFKMGNSSSYERFISIGDLVKVYRTGYQHWAIVDTSVDEDVWCYHITKQANNSISFQNPHSSNGVIKRETLERVTGGDQFTFDNQEDKGRCLLRKYSACMPDFEIVRDVLKEFEGRSVNYKLFDLNCEHFATFCRYGIGWSTQGEYRYHAKGVDKLFDLKLFDQKKGPDHRKNLIFIDQRLKIKDGIRSTIRRKFIDGFNDNICDFIDTLPLPVNRC